MQYRHVRTMASGFRTALRAVCAGPKDGVYAAGDSEVRLLGSNQRWATAKPALAVAVSPEGLIYVGEPGQVEIFRAQGGLAATWRDAERLGEVTAFGFFKDTVLVADSKDRCIRRFDKAGKFLSNIGKDNRLKGFLIPNGVLDFSVAADGTIHAANPGKHRVERYSQEGALLGHIGRFGQLDAEGFPGCCNPTNVTLGPAGRVFVTEKAGPRAKVLDPAGKLMAVIEDKAFDANCKNMDIAVDGRGRVYVADTVKLEVRVYEEAL